MRTREEQCKSRWFGDRVREAQPRWLYVTVRTQRLEQPSRRPRLRPEQISINERKSKTDMELVGLKKTRRIRG